jgi:Raf kinase inhibitor-like YbhB/YbcL family protein
MWRRVRSGSDRRGVLASVAAALATLSALVWPSVGRAAHPKPVAAESRLALQSPDLAPGHAISLNQVYDRAGCSGGNISPALSWRDAPAGTRSFAVLMFDPDAPGGGWWHWAVFDIPAAVRSLQADAGDPPRHLLPSGAIQVRNEYGSLGYGGPCPPPGPPHRYHFMIYALRLSKLGLDVSATPAQVAARALANALAEAEIVRPYGR